MISPTAAIVSGSSLADFTGVGVGSSLVLSSLLTVLGLHDSEIKNPTVKAIISIKFKGFDIIPNNSTDWMQKFALILLVRKI
jgi:hypothetical protein